MYVHVKILRCVAWENIVKVSIEIGINLGFSMRLSILQKLNKNSETLKINYRLVLQQ